MSWNLEEAIAYYRKQGAPGDQTALMGLLQEIQQKNGGTIPTTLLPTVAIALNTRESFLLALIRRMPRLRLSDKHLLEVCTGPNCGKAAKLAVFAENLASDSVTVRFVPCMHQCGMGPNVKWNGQLCSGMTEEKLSQLISQNKT